MDFLKIPSDGVPYPLFSFAALLPWTLFSEGLTRSTTSMVSNAGIMTKVYFPRLVMPISGILSPLVDFFIAFVILILMMAYYGFVPTIAIVLLPLFILLALATSLAIGLWLSALNIKYRDFQYTLPFIIQLGLYASPIVYPSSMIPEQFRIFYGLNPMAGVIEGFRWALLGTNPPEAMLLVSVGVVVVLLVGGLFYFKRVEQYFRGCGVIFMTDDIAIRVRGLGKKYVIGGAHEQYLTMRDAIVNIAAAPYLVVHDRAPPRYHPQQSSITSQESLFIREHTNTTLKVLR